jgi:Ca-activated chloride channel family protein
LDVDTASYSVARRYVMDGILPPASAVRVEEFVNYFDPGYANPQDVAFALYADGAPSPFEAGIHILRFGVQGYEVSEVDRKPASLTFVIDVSGSMELENRLGLVKQSLELLVERLQPTDTVAIVVYGSEARTVLYPTSGEDPDYILEAIYSLRTEGATNAEAGLKLGYQLAYEAYRPGAINRVILCSDGVANVGATGPDAILEQIRGYAETGITLTSVGFGMGNFNDVLMEQLADNGDGHYAYVDTLDEARKLFVDDLTSTLQVIAQDAKVQVDFNPDIVSRYRLLGYENRDVADQDFRDDSVDAGELGAGHSAVALYAVMLHPGAQGRIATVQLRWEDPDSHQVTEINGNFNTWDLADHFESADLYYQQAVITAYYAERLRLSPWTLEIPMSWLIEHAVRISGQLPADHEISQFTSLLSRAAQIKALNQ